MTDNIQIVTADGATVTVATHEIGGIHYPVSMGVRRGELIEAFPAADYAATDSNGTGVPTYGDPIELPIHPTRDVLVWIDLNSFTTAGDLSDWSTLSVGYDISLDGTNWTQWDQWGPIDTTWGVGSALPFSDIESFRLSANGLSTIPPFIRMWYLVHIGTGGDPAVDTANFRVVIQSI